MTPVKRLLRAWRLRDEDDQHEYALILVAVSALREGDDDFWFAYETRWARVVRRLTGPHRHA